MTTRPWAWTTNTAPFSELHEPTKPALFVVEQVSDKDFRIPIGLGFQYNPADGAPPLVVIHSSPETTDFASIPRYLSWFVSRHGRHTPAALAHDHLVVDGMDLNARARADRLFRDMMDDLEVPPVQSRVMWAAVALATRHHGPPWTRLGLVIWAILAAVGIGTLAWGLVTVNLWLILLALIGPVIAALFWGHHYPAGLIAGYALPIVALPAITCLVSYWIYWLIEQAIRLARRPRTPQPDQLPEPIGYQGR
jgi:Protein of unknown function (DUF1353)